MLVLVLIGKVLPKQAAESERRPAIRHQRRPGGYGHSSHRSKAED